MHANATIDIKSIMSEDRQESMNSIDTGAIHTSANTKMTPSSSIPQHEEIVVPKEEDGAGIVDTEESSVCSSLNDAVLAVAVNHKDGIPQLQFDASTNTNTNTNSRSVHVKRRSYPIPASAEPTVRELLMRKYKSTSGIVTSNARRSYQGMTERTNANANANASYRAANANANAKPNNINNNNNNKQNNSASITATEPNYCIHSDLDDSPPLPLPVIVDSHTSYRKIIDDEITKLKFQLTKAQSIADSLEHELKKRNLSCMLLEEQLSLVKRQRLESTKQVHQLETVVGHLQNHARESALERANFDNQHVELKEECLIYQHASKKYKSECRKLRKEVDNVRQDLEGRCMENQGLKSENDWLKNQLWPGKAGGGEETDSDLEAEERDRNRNLKNLNMHVHGGGGGANHFIGIKQFLSPLSPPTYRRRRKRPVASSAQPAYQQSLSPKQEHEQEQEQEQTTEGEETEGATIPMPLMDDNEDQTAGYTSLTDFQLKSASESGIDIAHINTRNKPVPRSTSFISKLALRHGISSNPDDSSKSAQSYRSTNVDNVDNLRAENRAARKSARKLYHSHESSSSFKSVALDPPRRPSFKSTLSKLSLRETDREEDEDANANAVPWSIWGIFTGTGASSKPSVDRTDKTKELSDCSHSSEEFIQNTNRTPVHTGMHIGTGTGTKIETKPSSSVLMPKRLTSVL